MGMMFMGSLARCLKQKRSAVEKSNDGSITSNLPCSSSYIVPLPLVCRQTPKETFLISLVSSTPASRYKQRRQAFTLPLQFNVSLPSNKVVVEWSPTGALTRPSQSMELGRSSEQEQFSQPLTEAKLRNAARIN